METAFDSLGHAFIFATLANFGFGKNCIQWIRTFLYNGSSCIMNNDFSTGYFSLERGARQGDPLSPYIFVLCLEILFIKIRSNKAIKGFKFEKLEVKLTSFADDVTFLIKDPCSLKKNSENNKRVWNFSPLKINVYKCEACWTGRSKANTGKPV